MPVSDRPVQIASARPEMTAAIVARTGLDELVLRDLVYRFYAKVRCDAVLGPIFARHVVDWEPHLERMVAFWSSVALMTGRYHGHPVTAHTRLPIRPTDFERWLSLFRQAAAETCTQAGAAHVVERAERIAHTLRMAVSDAQAGSANSR